MTNDLEWIDMRPLTVRHCYAGEVSELADEHDLGSCAARRRSSSLLFPTSIDRTLKPRFEAAA